MGEFKIIEDALSGLAPIVIKELKDELAFQKHIASGRLYNGFRGKKSITTDSISLHIINDSNHMWIVNDGKAGGVNASYEDLKKWALTKQGRGELEFSSMNQLNNFVNKVKAELEKNYLTAGGNNVAPRRYFFISITADKIRNGGALDKVKSAIVEQVNSEVLNGLLNKSIKITIG